ncbi:phospholipase [Allokutzneria sp. NRRL B-24872]|uniref:phospholipase n=1 Tax=Allokutzneria sp. NRRL B-24872 TaxID=1137961 RepID=UPI000A37733C|nr:phospholipase [Allokutzneria sp. NRRL B-24872]
MRTSRGFQRLAPRVRAGVTAIVALALSLAMGAGTAQAIDVRAVTDDYMFSKSLAEFGQIRLARPYDGELDWSTDGCTLAPDRPFGFQVLPACHRHDFGYGNFTWQGRFDSANRLRIDNKFRDDMYLICGGNWGCRRVADIYYYAVRAFGGSGSTADALNRSDVKAAARAAATR